MSNEGRGQQPNSSETHQDRLSVLINAEVAKTHVGLGEHEAITGYRDGRVYLLGSARM